MNAYSNDPIKVLLDFYLVPPDFDDTVWNIVSQTWYNKLWSAEFAVSTDVRCKSPEQGIMVVLMFAILYDWYGSYNG